MKIRSQLLLLAALFVVVLLVIGASVVATTAELDRLDGQARLADRVELAANDLNYLAGEYLLYGEPQQLERWAARDAELGADLANLSAGDQQRQALIAAIGADRERLESVFGEIGAQRNGTGPPLDPVSLRTSWSRVGVQTQALAFDAGRLSTLLVAEADAAQFANTVEMTTLLGVFAAFVLAGVFVVGRRTLASVTALQAGADVVGSGGLGHTIPLESDDEIGDLARSFNRMSADLATVTASKADLEREVERRTRAEEGLRESERRYRELVESANSAIVRWQRDGTVTYFNESAQALFGYDADEVIGKNVGILVPERDSAGADLTGLVPAILEEPGGRTTNVNENVRRDGSRLWMLWTNRTIRDEQGAVTEVLSVGTDITKRMQAEEALRKSEEEYRHLVEHAPTGIYEIDYTGPRLRRVNDAMCSILGYAREELLAMNPEDLLDEESRERFRDRVRRVAAGEPVDDSVAFRVLRRDGRAIRAALTVRPIWTNGRMDGALVVAHDITERIESEEALREYAENLRRSNEDLERFAYVSSHDLQEPLRSIVSFSQLLERRYRGRLDQDADEYIEFIVEGGTRMQTLILDLLAYSRVNTKAQELRPTDAEAVMASVERNLDFQLREAGAVLTADPLPTVTADPLQLEQVFTNLVSNAIKFRRPDEPLRIHVGARRIDGFWEFSVADNGIGIEPEYYDRIFVIFQRLHTKEAYPGTGIGLAIVKRIVDRHGGTIRVESTPGEGSTFFFTLPAA
ncbi:MAG: PAS domain S-box protein [Methanospirillum sp.]